MKPEKPLTIEMIETANKIYSQLNDWQAIDRALFMLRENLPGFSFEEILLKANAVNTLYGTYVYATWKAAKHIYSLMKNIEPENVEIELVEEMAKIPETNRRFTSFASKFSHFFINEEKFPIKDSFAENMIRYHLGSKNLSHFQDRPYYEYYTNITNLKQLFAYKGSNRTFDRYLWLAGQYKEWKEKNNKAEINTEVRLFFNNHNNINICHTAFGNEI